ncbi:threonine--tRNA ligase [Candidatus Peregrinibacteria bacterium CG10_big_fil_rev_8_21_14_0_10_49_24]|nr:MAG: threonine--tRNA ligase [Candidatus Peregrinibacteria bacterium CG11_big_fil_rev_8_21_14_0_20_49_14]PIR51250.1 MAG: threonine--tRNA ligase [Candidatus Peregrinibacteria bacterium CG10_big_fil_rev_8_21_14_0_10_49_24]PJA67660.1 MAG: threonine--tRNA ligase [Candidatus Peregrinibacteria bacterium CG_4_9_14_3_um_filter_49_12]
MNATDYKRIANPRLEFIVQGAAQPAVAKKATKAEKETAKVKVDDLYRIRHSLAHVLAQAVLKLWPKTKISIGPPIDTGCYYDFLFAEPISDTDFKTIEKEMRSIINRGQTFESKSLSIPDALSFWKEQKQPFKVELIEDLAAGGETEVTNYANLDKDGSVTFTDLCKGGHVENLKEIPADGFKIMSLAGAYWRGDETREQLTRIYVAAFASKEELKAHLEMLEEAKKRDHRKLGKEMDLFTFSDMVGPGLPLWTAKGTIIADAVEDLAKETEASGGYFRVRTPHIAKGKLYEQTGHLSHYKQSMFPAMQLDGEEEYYLKPMNCPHHHQIFASQPRSYRELPMRLAEYGHCYRYEDSGALFGLMRVRSLTMNDAHIYCSEEQFEQEFIAVANMYLKYFEIFGVEKYEMRLSLHDPKELGKKYVNEPELWLKTEEMVRNAMKKAGCTFREVENEAAFYGPKIDVEVWSAIGREFTLATNQVDFDVPGKVGLSYTAADGTEKVPLCIHRAPLGTHERFIGFLIEHFAGHFPLWLAPVQVGILPVASAHEEYGRCVESRLKEAGIRTEYYDANESLGKRIREGEKMRVPYLLVLGDKEAGSDGIAVRNVRSKEQVEVTFADFLSKTVADIAQRRRIHSIGSSS